MNEDNTRSVGTGFNQKVYAEVRRIPAGQVSTYGDIAYRLGSPRIARHVGWALAALTSADDDVPWHRVINAKGQISAKDKSLHWQVQAHILQSEGIEVSAAGSINLVRFRWQLKDTDHEAPLGTPLESM